MEKNTHSHPMRHKIFDAFRIIFITFASLFIMGMHYIAFAGLTDVFNFSESVESFMKVFFVIMSFSFVLANFLIDVFPSKISNFIYQVSAFWVGLLFPFVLISILIFFLQFLFVIFLPSVFSTFQSNYLDIFLGMFNNLYFNYFAESLFLFAIILNIYGVYNGKKIRVVEQDIFIKNLPSNWKNKKAIHISDTHYGPVHGGGDAKKVVSIINEINKKEISSGNISGISFLFHTGDFYDGPKIDWAKSASEYKNIDVNIKKYFVSGNHDEYAQIGDEKDDIVSHIKKAGFIISDGKVFDEGGVNIIGIDYVQGSKSDKAQVQKVFQKVKNKYPSLVLKHVPNNIDVASNLGASLILCGHTHNGQMFPFNFLTKYIYKGFNYKDIFYLKKYLTKIYRGVTII